MDCLRSLLWSLAPALLCLSRHRFGLRCLSAALCQVHLFLGRVLLVPACGTASSSRYCACVCAVLHATCVRRARRSSPFRHAGHYPILSCRWVCFRLCYLLAFVFRAEAFRFQLFEAKWPRRRGAIWRGRCNIMCRPARRTRRIQALLLLRVATVVGVLGDVCLLCHLHCDWMRLHAFVATANKKLAARYTYVCRHAGVAALGPGPAGRLATRQRVRHGLSVGAAAGVRRRRQACGGHQQTRAQAT